MDEQDTKITAALHEIMKDASFTPAALKLVNTELDKVKALEYRVETLKRAATDKQDVNVRLEDLKRLETKRADQAVEMANKNAEMQVDLAAAQAKASTLESCFELVFRNQAIHRNVVSSVPINEPLGDGLSQTNYHTKTETVVEESK